MAQFGNIFSTEDEKTAVAHILIELIKIDNNVAVEEIEYMLRLQIAFGVSKNILEKATTQDINTSLAKIKNMLPSKKHSFLLMMIRMAESDGKICEREVEAIARIAKQCNISIPDYLNRLLY